MSRGWLPASAKTFHLHDLTFGLSRVLSFLHRLQGRLILDKPYPFAAPQHSMPFCQEFQGCSCCNASHAVTIRNDMLHLSLDGSVSPQCLQDVQAHSCSVCDPWVRNALSHLPSISNIA